jgi:hypothetical protein
MTPRPRGRYALCAAWETPEALTALLTLVPRGRIGVPEDIGKAAVWLASDDARSLSASWPWVWA